MSEQCGRPGRLHISAMARADSAAHSPYGRGARLQIMVALRGFTAPD